MIEHEIFTENGIIIVDFWGDCYRVDEGFHHEFGYHEHWVTYCEDAEYDRSQHNLDEIAAIEQYLRESKHIVINRICEQFDSENYGN